MSGDIDLSLYAGGYMYVILVRLRNALQGVWTQLYSLSGLVERWQHFLVASRIESAKQLFCALN